MKHILPLLLVASLSACKNPADTARANAIGNLLVNYGEKRQIISKEDAELVRNVGVIIVSTTPAPAAVETASGK